MTQYFLFPPVKIAESGISKCLATELFFVKPGRCSDQRSLRPKPSRPRAKLGWFPADQPEPTSYAVALWHFCSKYRRLGRFCRLDRLGRTLPSITYIWIGTFTRWKS